MSTQYVISKTGVRARITLVGQQSRWVELFLGDRAQCHSGSERASDLMASDAEFIPVRSARSLDVFLLRRDSVMILSVPAEHEAAVGEEERRLMDSDEAVTLLLEIVLIDGSRIT